MALAVDASKKTKHENIGSGSFMQLSILNGTLKDEVISSQSFHRHVNDEIIIGGIVKKSTDRK